MDVRGFPRVRENDWCGYHEAMVEQDSHEPEEQSLAEKLGLPDNPQPNRNVGGSARRPKPN